MSVSAGASFGLSIRAFNHEGRVLKLPSALAARQEFNQRGIKQFRFQGLACVSVETKSAALRLNSELLASLVILIARRYRQACRACHLVRRNGA
jgi:hypothetical protein